MKINFLVLMLCFLVLPLSGFAQSQTDPFKSTPYELPRFVSLAKDKAFMRTGPGSRFPVKWVYKRRNLPLEVILEFENWRKVRDHTGEEGWMHLSLLSGRRYVLAQGDDVLALRRKAGDNSVVIAYLEPNVIARVKLCDDLWCHIETSGYQGWTYKRKIWGVYSDEILKK